MPNATQLRLRIYLYTSTTGTFWFDDFSLDDGAPARFPFQAGFPVVASGWVWYSSPAVADIDQDGDNELLIGAGNALNGWDKTGASLPGFPLSTGDRLILPQIAIANLDQDAGLEIVAGTRTTSPEGQCRVFAWQDNGALLSGWPKSVAWNTEYSNSDCWITSVVLADIDGDQDQETLASTTNNASGNPSANITPPNLYAWHGNGALASGSWPNGHTTAGFYGAIAAGDLDGNGIDDIIAARDHHYLNAYSGAGNSMAGWPITTYLNGNSGNYQTDYRLVHGASEPVSADLDGDGIMEYIVIADITGPGSSVVRVNSALLVLNPNGTRRSGWETPALGNGVLTQVDLPRQAPAIADLNADGQLEIIAATNDGWIRAYRADKTVLWAFNYTQGGTLFATEPVIGDIDGDSGLEIVFGTRIPMQAGGNWDGPVGVWALEANGTVATGFPLAIPTPGVRAAPTLADLDGDGGLEILAATLEGRIFVWDTPTTYNPARMPWPTGRHDLRRSASYLSLTPPTPTPTSATTATTTQTPTRTNTPAATATPTGTPSPTPTRTATSTATRTATSTPTPVATSTSTFSPTPTGTAISTATRTATSTPTSTSSPPNTIFTISHEANNFNEYEITYLDGGNLSISNVAALNGTRYGLSVNFPGGSTTPKYGVKGIDLLSASDFRCLFYFDPNTITLSNANIHILNATETSTGYQLLGVVFKYSSSNYRLFLGVIDDSHTYSYGSEIRITDAPHFIEVLAHRSSSAGSRDGFYRMWIDGKLRSTIRNVSNYNQFGSTNQIIFGAPSGVVAGVTGRYYIDEIKANQDGSSMLGLDLAFEQFLPMISKSR